MENDLVVGIHWDGSENNRREDYDLLGDLNAEEETEEKWRMLK